jgi:hypothetical protein
VLPPPGWGTATGRAERTGEVSGHRLGQVVDGPADTHSAAGGLSTVTVLPASVEPKKNAVQFSVIARTAPE